jgi:Arc/MetJ-type ribon-helix-helix transcriptional regulator
MVSGAHSIPNRWYPTGIRPDASVLQMRDLVISGQEMITMSKMVRVSDETAEIIQRTIDQGLYTDAESVVAEAMRLFREFEDDGELRAQLQVGIDQIARGEVLEWTPELNDRLFAQAMERVKLAKKSDLGA